MSSHEMLGGKLNKGLDPKKFKICVPKKSELLMNWELDTKKEAKGNPKKGSWESYLEELAEAYDLKWQPKAPYEDCVSCDCKPGRVLRGDWAIAHACRVHDRIHRQALGLEQVSAIDVGFAIKEQKKQFDNLLAIRIHVNRKQSPDQLIRLGFASLTQAASAVPRSQRGNKTSAGQKNVREDGGRRVAPLTFCRYPGEDPIRQEPPPCDHSEGTPCGCCCTKRYRELWKLLNEEFDDLRRTSGGRSLSRLLDHYPISGVGEEDLSIFCEEGKIPERLNDLRLCICGVPIDVINAEYNPSAANHPGGDADSGVFVGEPRRSDELSDAEVDLIGRGRVNPLVGGISVGSITGQAGTLGTIVWDRTDGTPCVLSNWHVLAGTPTAQVGQPTYQPALFDGGTEDDVVAHLKRWRLGTEGDAAIAELSGSRDYASGEVLGLWHPISGYLAPKLNMEVRKWGRTTGFTQGFVDGIHLATNIDYGRGVVRYFKEQFHIAPLVRGQDVSQVGDSGSLVVTSLRPVETQDALEKICEWFRQYLGSKTRGELRHSINEDLEQLKKSCKELAACSTVCKVLEGFKPGECIPDTNGDKPCCCVKKYWDTFRLEWAEVYDRWHEESQLPVVSGSGTQRDWPGSSMRYWSERIKRPVDKISIKTLEGNNITIDEGHESSGEGHESSDASTGTIGELGKCIELCAEVEKFFGHWYAECRRIEFCERLQTVLTNASGKLTTLDPWEWVCFIEEKLSAPHQCKPDENDDEPDDYEDGGGSTQLAKASNPCEAKCDEGAFASVFANDLVKLGYDSNNPDEDWFVQILKSSLDPEKPLLKALVDQVTQFKKDQDDAEKRAANRAYYAVGLIFAGDTPGSPFGEFAVASEVSRLAETLRFSLRPVFEPRSSFRELRVRPTRQRVGEGALRSRRGIGPRGGGDDPRGGGPQPDTEPFQSGSGSGSGGG